MNEPSESTPQQRTYEEAGSIAQYELGGQVAAPLPFTQPQVFCNDPCRRARSNLGAVVGREGIGDECGADPNVSGVTRMSKALDAIV